MELFFQSELGFQFYTFWSSNFPLITLVLHHQLGQSYRFFFHVYPFFFWIYFSLSFLNFLWGQKWVTTYSFFFTMLTKQNLIKILHSEFVKKKVFVGLVEWSTHLGIPKTFPFFFKKKMVLLSWVAYPFLKLKKLVYFHGQHAPFEIQRWISASLCASLKLVYFYRRPLTRPKDWCLLLSVGVSK
jgi:hypothetical protein